MYTHTYKQTYAPIYVCISKDIYVNTCTLTEFICRRVIGIQKDAAKYYSVSNQLVL